MKHPTNWATPDDVANKLQSRSERGQSFTARLGGMPPNPREAPSVRRRNRIRQRSQGARVRRRLAHSQRFAGV
jgi:hypothetical protein